MCYAIYSLPTYLHRPWGARLADGHSWTDKCYACSRVQIVARRRRAVVVVGVAIAQRAVISILLAAQVAVAISGPVGRAVLVDSPKARGPPLRAGGQRRHLHARVQGGQWAPRHPQKHRRPFSPPTGEASHPGKIKRGGVTLTAPASRPHARLYVRLDWVSLGHGMASFLSTESRLRKL